MTLSFETFLSDVVADGIERKGNFGEVLSSRTSVSPVRTEIPTRIKPQKVLSKRLRTGFGPLDISAGDVPYFTGSLFESLRVSYQVTNFRRVGDKYVGTVKATLYSRDSRNKAVIRYTDEGTGVFGPKRRVIRPKTAKALRWIDRFTGETVFAESVRGYGYHKGWFAEAEKKMVEAFLKEQL